MWWRCNDDLLVAGVGSRAKLFPAIPLFVANSITEDVDARAERVASVGIFRLWGFGE